MIIEEQIILNDIQFVKHYSDADYIIRKVGTDEEYSEAIDAVPCKYEYEETDKKIEKFLED